MTSGAKPWDAKLEERGVRFEKTPALNPKFNIYHCFLSDPNGYLIEIQRLEDPGWKMRGVDAAPNDMVSSQEFRRNP